MSRSTLLRGLLLVALAGASAGYALRDTPSVWLETPGESVFAGAAAVLADPMFIAFGLFLAWLTFALVDVRSTRRLPRLLRIGGYRALLVDVAARALRALAAPAVVVIAAATATALIAHPEHAVSSDIGQRIDAAGVPAGAALAIELVMIGAFFVAVRLVIELLAVAFSFGVVVTVSACAWVWATASASGFLSVGPLANFGTYTAELTLVENPALIVPVVAAYAVLSAAIATCATLLDRDARRGGARAPAWAATSLGAFVVILLATFSLGTASFDVFTHVAIVFAGPTASPLQMLIGLVLVVGYAFTAMFRLERELGARAPLTLIRHGSRLRQAGAIALRELRLAAIYTLSVAVSAVAAYAIAAGRDFRLPSAELVSLLVFQVTLVQLLQLLCYLALIGAVVLVVDSAVAGLATVGVLTGLAALPIPLWVAVPIQRSATAAVAPGGWPIALANTLVLILTTAAAFVVVVCARDLRAHIRPLAARPGAAHP